MRRKEYSLRHDWLYWWTPPIIVMLVLFISSGTPGNDIPKFTGLLDFLVKKGGHLFGYGLLALTYRRALARGRRPRLGISALSLGLAVLYGISDEYHQSFTLGRSSSGVDVAIDGLGALLGLLLAEVFARRRKPRAALPNAAEDQNG